MARRTHRHEDPARTEILAIDELFVEKGKGNQDFYYTYLYDDIPECCPVCGGKEIKTHNLFSRNYTDYIIENGSPRIITQIYEFYKYRCLNPDCNRVFSADINFATIHDNVTRRLEDKIAEMVISGYSYGGVSSSFQERLSRQAVGQIFNRWVRYRDEQRITSESPQVIGATTGLTDKGEYALIFSCDDGIRVLDILLGIDSDRITASLRRFGKNAVKCILTDCNPTIYAAAKEALPNALHIIPAEMWFRLVRNDFIEYTHPMLRWVPVKNKENAILEPRAPDEMNRSYDMRRIIGARKNLERPYNNFHTLREAITNREIRWFVQELDEWPDSIDPGFREQLTATLIQYNEYRAEITQHQEHPEFVPENLLLATDRLEELIKARRSFSEEALQAAVLYSIETDLKNWQGIPIEKIIVKLTRLQESRKRKEYDYE